MKKTTDERVEAEPAIEPAPTRTVDAVVDDCLGHLTEGSSGDDVAEALEQLATKAAQMEELQQEVARARAAQRLKDLGLGTTRMVDAALRGRADNKKRPSLPNAKPEPWPEPVSGAQLAEQLRVLFERHVMLPAGGAVAAALYVLFTYVSDVASVSPSLAMTSLVKRCGKTTMMGILSETVRDPLPTSNATVAAVFRSIELYSPTLLIDEAETFITRENHELRGILNSGHLRQTAYVLRCEGDDHRPKPFCTWCPKGFALIGRLPSTLEDRSIVIPLRRRLQHEHVDRWEPERMRTALLTLRRKLVRWANDHRVVIGDQRPEPICGLHDRAADNWRPLCAIAAVLGAGWLESAHEAALALAALQPPDGADHEVMILEDLRTLFARYGDRLASAFIVDHLNQLEHRPWPEWQAGREMTKAQLAKLLLPFGVRPKTLRFGEVTARGYEAGWFADAFARYLPADASQAEQVEPEEEEVA